MPTLEHPKEDSTQKGKLKAVGVVAGASAAAVALRYINPSGGPSFGCPIKTLTGLDCPLCGGTRATHFLLQGDVSSAIDLNMFAVFVVLPTLFVFLIWSTVTLWRSNSWKIPNVTVPMIVLFVGFGVLRNLPFAWAEPLRTY